MAAARLLPLFHRLFPAFVVSPEVPLTGSILIESVKVLPTKSPATANNSAFELSAAEKLPHSARVKPKNFGSLP